MNQRQENGRIMAIVHLAASQIQLSVAQSTTVTQDHISKPAQLHSAHINPARAAVPAGGTTAENTTQYNPTSEIGMEAMARTLARLESRNTINSLR
jgi:hypothetical protein